MAHVIVRQGIIVVADQNKSGTELASVSPPRLVVNDSESGQPKTAREECVYVVRAVVPGVLPFCGLPTVKGSAYCARHRSLCVVSSESATGRALAEALVAEGEAPEPPPELAHLVPPALPERQPEERREELRSLLDHPPPAPGTELAE